MIIINRRFYEIGRSRAFVIVRLCCVCVHVCVSYFIIEYTNFFIYEASDAKSDSIKRSCVRASVRYHFCNVQGTHEEKRSEKSK